MNYSDIFSLTDCKAIITGGAGYLGSEIVKGYLDFGAKVVVADNADKTTDEIFPDVSSPGNLRLIKCDLSSTEDVKRLYSESSQWMGGFNTLVACAAYTGYAGTGTVADMTDETFDEGIDGTLGLTFRCIREAIPYMKDGGGSIITFGSLYAWIAPDFSIYDSGNVSPPNYGAGKAAIVQLTRHCASQFAEMNIRVNSISPGSYPHPKNFRNENFMSKLSGRTMMKRIGYPDDLVGAAVFLASKASKYMTAANISVDGGQLSW